MSNKIYIGNLSFRADPSDLISALEDQFGACGEIDDISVIEDRQTGKIKGFGFISFSEEGSVKKALELDGQDLLGRPLRVSLAKENEKRN